MVGRGEDRRYGAGGVVHGTHCRRHLHESLKNVYVMFYRLWQVRIKIWRMGSLLRMSGRSMVGGGTKTRETLLGSPRLAFIGAAAPPNRRPRL